MIPALSIAGLVFTAVVCFGIPIAAAIYLYKKDKTTLRAITVGALVFFLFQITLRVPMLSVLFPKIPGYASMAENIWIQALILGLSAGVFEEFGRVFGYKALLKNRDRWIDGVAFGVGHGGIEAILIVGVNAVANAVMAIGVNAGNYSNSDNPEMMEAINKFISQFNEVSVVDLFSSGVERIFAMILQIALSILVLYALKNRKYIYIGVAILAHLLIDSLSIILYQEFKWNTIAIEAMLFVLAVVAAAYIVKARELFKTEEKTVTEIQ